MIGYGYGDAAHYRCVLCLRRAANWDGPFPYCSYCWASGSTCHARYFLGHWERNDRSIWYYENRRDWAQLQRILVHNWSQGVYVERHF